MFQFRRFPTYAYLIQRRLTEYCSAGFPHSEILGSTPMCGSPRLIAACHVLLRLLMPRHSPCALSSLTSSTRTSYPSLSRKRESSLTASRLLSLANPFHWASLGFWSEPFRFSSELCRPQSFFGFSLLCYPNYLKLHKNFYLLCCLLFTSGISSSLFSFQGADLWSRLKPDTSIQSFEYLYLSSMVEISGLEPLTPCLQSRCSPS